MLSKLASEFYTKFRFVIRIKRKLNPKLTIRSEYFLRTANNRLLLETLKKERRFSNFQREGNELQSKRSNVIERLLQFKQADSKDSKSNLPKPGKMSLFVGLSAELF